MRVLAPLALSALLIAGCYAPAPADGVQGCSDDSAHLCPDGYTCLADKKCHLDGTALPGCTPACGGATSVCDLTDPARPVCVACLADKDCATGTLCVKKACMPGCSAAHSACGADAGSCDVDLGVCRGCLGDADCGGATPHCDVPTGSCQPCLPGADTCPPGKYCGGSAGNYACTGGCKTSAECQPPGPDGGVPGDGGVDGGVPMSAAACCAHKCVDTGGDAANCGACGKACAMAEACCAGACSNTTSDLANCGGCGQACAPAHSVGAMCAMSSCGFMSCATNFADCDKKPQTGCEVSTADDAANCGGCGKVCPAVAHAQPGCKSGACGYSACDVGFGDCNKMPGDGCEVSLAGDIANCGGCGAVCKIPNGAPACIKSRCAIASCNQGYSDCINGPADGCETNTASDVKNCGACGNVCPNGSVCSSGNCKMQLYQVVGTLGNSTFYKVPVMGPMTDTNIFNACRAAGFSVGCQGPPMCMYNDLACAPTPEASCGNPMQSLSMAICNGMAPGQCAALNGIFQYMGHKWMADDACGVFNGTWCFAGSMTANQFALCVR